ncbi:MAG: hypothetical protein GC200_04580 [Tepidisphaera sp.]|nr:hypothetical protein [Tepidisphaera sp.]
MPTAALKPRPVWSDRFARPDAEALATGFPKLAQGAFDLARARLKAIEDVREEVQWRGVWNWTFAYLTDDGEPPIGFLVPDPERPRLCLPFPDALIADLPVRKLARGVRDVLAHAPVVDGLRWPMWDLSTKTETEDLLALLNFRRTPARAGRDGAAG